MHAATHLPLVHRKSLAIRLAYFVSSIKLGTSFQGSGSKINLDGLTRELVSLIAESDDLEKDDVPLDYFLRGVLNKFEGYLENKLKAKNSRLFSALLGDFKDAALSISCPDCSHLPGKVCNGGPDDDAIVEKRGQCIWQLHQMFNIASEVARTYYLRYGDASLTKYLPNISFSTDFHTGRPHNFPVDYYVTGKTIYQDSLSHRLSRVILYISVKDFDEMTYLATLYVMFHECIAHAFHGIIPGNKRSSPKESDRFAEGWMDWVALKILEEVGIGDGPAPDVLSRIDFPTERLDRAHDFHFSRTDYRKYTSSRGYGDSNQSPRTIAVRLADGKLAANKVFNLIKHRPNLCPNPFETIVKLSFDLNMLNDFAEDKRESFVAVMNYLTENENLSGFGQQSPHFLVANLLCDYLKYKSTYKLLDGVSRLEQHLRQL